MSLQSLSLDIPFQDLSALRKKVIRHIHPNNTLIIFGFLGVCFVVVTLGYFATTTALMEKSYNISALNRDIGLEREHSKALEITLSEERDLPHLLDRTSSLLYTEIQRMNYIERPNNSPFGVIE